MFVNDQDTILLHGALLSAVTGMKTNDSPSECVQLKYTIGLPEIVSSTIIKLTRDTSKVENEIKYLERQLYLNRRLHAVIFYATLKSNGITCAEANNYYESIDHDLPFIDWKTYIELNFLCDWSEYFIECSIQLEAEVLVTVLRGLMKNDEDDLKHYAWHLVLQSFTWKFFSLDDPSLLCSPKDCTFHFPFFNARSAPEVDKLMLCENPSKSKLLHVFVTILNRLLESPKFRQESYIFSKVVLHFYKTTFKLLLKMSVPCGESIKELFRMNPLLKMAAMNEMAWDVTKMELDGHRNFLLDHCYLTESWEICRSYLMFLVCNYSMDSQPLLNDIDVSAYTISSLFPPSKDSELLSGLCPLFASFYTVEKEDFNARLLRTVILYDYPYASRAAKVFLSHPEMRFTKDIMDILKEHSTKLSPSETYKLLAINVVEAPNAEIKEVYLNLFYDALSRGSKNLYNDALEFILKHYGINEHFQLPTFKTCLMDYTYKTILLDEAKNILLPLFIQMPLTVLKTLVEQALLRGGEDGIAKIPVLKYIPSVCHYKDNFPLAVELSQYFLGENIESRAAKYLTSLIESLMEVQTEKEIIPFDMFLKLCILPSFSKNIRVDLALECLNVSLKVLGDKAALNISNDSFYSLFDYLTYMIDDCIQSGNGRRKELILLAFFYLSNSRNALRKLHGRSTSCIKSLNTVNEVVLVYCKPFCKEELYEAVIKVHIDKMQAISEVIWTHCCHSEDLKSEFQKILACVKISHEELQEVLVKLFSHFTKDEWVKSTYLLKEYFEYSSPEVYISKFSALFPKSNPQLYAVIRTLMDCYSSVLEISSCDFQYVTKCFNTTIDSLLNEEEHPQLLLNVFLDACYLTNDRIDILHLLSSVLISIKKKICTTCKEESVRENYLKLASFGIKCLPDSDAKSSLLQIFQ